MTIWGFSWGDFLDLASSSPCRATNERKLYFGYVARFPAPGSATHPRREILGGRELSPCGQHAYQAGLSPASASLALPGLASKSHLARTNFQNFRYRSRQSEAEAILLAACLSANLCYASGGSHTDFETEASIFECQQLDLRCPRHAQNRKDPMPAGDSTDAERTPPWHLAF